MAARAAPSKTVSPLRAGQLRFAALVLLPIMVLFLVIRIAPILQMLADAPTNRSLRRPVSRFVGLENFSRMWEDPAFVAGFKNSMAFVALAPLLEIVLGLLVAIVMSRVVRFESLYQTLYFLPYILPMVPAAIVWKWIYEPGAYGLANLALGGVGIGPVGWLTNSRLALLLIIGVHVWKHLGFFVVVFLVGLKAIPQDLREASALDGASAWRTVRSIDLPLLRPIVLFGATMATIWAWSSFTEVYVMTQGSDISAGSDLKVLVSKIYEEGFQYGNIGYASALSLLLFAISVGIVALLFTLFRERT